MEYLFHFPIVHVKSVVESQLTYVDSTGFSKQKTFLGGMPLQSDPRIPWYFPI